MTIEVRPTVADADIAANATLRLERAATADGFLADGASEIASIALVEGQGTYIYDDPAGTPSSWYRTRLADDQDPTGYSAYSAAFQGVLVPLVSLASVLAAVGIDAGDARAPQVQLLLDAVSAEVRRITRRDLEGSPTTWDEIYRLHGQREFVLRRVPVVSIDSIRRVAFDGTEEEPYLATEWRLEDAARGALRLAARPPYVRVVHTTTGQVPPQLTLVALEWCKTRWADIRERNPSLAGYTTGHDAETYFADMAGSPPLPAARTMAQMTHLSGGGVI